jgi:hypothetical protein
MENQKHRRGRPRIHASNATRQKKYRERRKSTRPPTTADPLAWNEFLVQLRFGVNAGMFIEDAHAGCGLLHSGGNDGVSPSSAGLNIPDPRLNLEEMCNRGRRVVGCGGGRPVRPRGAGPDK